MAQESKLDLLLKTIEENEKKRVEAEERNRADLVSLKLAMEIRVPEVEKKVEELSVSLGELSHKVEHLEGNMLLQLKEQQGYSGIPIMNTPFNTEVLAWAKKKRRSVRNAWMIEEVDWGTN
ncbi:uncharacterized protein LOC102708299 [Oryza brachyantha]|uniref:uncharacterized protein LOC102708299 n=1 Tax=Oryza brachyantha TaxID=4533 RepID=UPI00077631B6|nr:uncharacterized protein LOC102708299 [Oryza brachyantha]